MAKPKLNKGRVDTSKLQFKPGAWLTNVGKSVGQSVFDVLQDVMPATAEIASNSGEYVMNFKDHMQELKAKRQQIKQSMEKNVYLDIGREALTNAIKDAKAGKFYTSPSEDMADDFDMDFGDDWDVGDDGDFSFASEDGNTKVRTHTRNGNNVEINDVSVHVDIGEDSPMVSAINKQSEVTTQVGQHAAELSKVNTTTLVRELSEFNEKSSGYLSSIDSNIATITSTVPTVMSQHAALSAKYYEDSMGIFNTISKNLQEMRDSMLNASSINGDVSYADGKYDDVLDIFSANGIINLKDYGQLVAKQFDSALDRNLITSTIKNFVTDTDSLRSIVSHPLNLLTESLLKKVIPETLRQSANEFDSMLQEAAVSGLYRVRGLSRSNNPILQILGETFGIGNKLKSDVDKSNYNRGKVDWNGESHKTLNEVIPFYLRKIAAGVTGTAEMVFDYQNGVFVKGSDAKEEYIRSDENKLLGDLKGVLSDFKEYIGENNEGTGGLVFTEERQRKKVEDTFRNMLLKMVRQDGTTAYLKNGKFDNYVAELLTGDGENVDSQIVRLIASFMNTDRFRGGYGASALGSMQLSARNAFSKYKLREESGEEATLGRYVNNGADSFDEHLQRNLEGKVTDKINYKVSPFIDRDKYGKGTTYYAREILKLLASGIRVYGISDTQDSQRIVNKSTDVLGKLQYQSDHYNREKQQEQDRHMGRALSQEDIENRKEKGKTVIDLNTITPDQLDSVIANLNDYDRARLYEQQQEEKGKGSILSRILGLSGDTALSRFLAKIQNPSDMLTDFFDKAKRTMFDLIYGDPNDENSVVNKIFKTIQLKLRQGASWLNAHVFEPMSHTLFGEHGLMTRFKTFLFGKRDEDGEWEERGIFGKAWDNLFGEEGIFAKIKETQMYQDFKTQWSKFKEYIFGVKDQDGNYTGGLFSDTMTQLGQVGRSVKEALVGKGDDSVLSNAKRMFTSLKDNVMTLFGYDKEEASRKRQDPDYNPFRDAIDNIWSRVKTRTNDLLDDILGPDGSDGSPVSRRREFVDKFREEMKGKRGELGAGAVIGGLGAALFGSKLGFVSSLFLPNGFIGGALLGLGITVIKNSDQIKKFLFGDKNEDGEYQGGLVGKSVIDFFQNNKKGMITGSFLGLASSVGFLPAWFMPGGPIGGALIGSAIQFAVNTDAFQTFLYGPADENGNRDGSGILGKVRKLITNDEGHLRAMDAAIGAGVGFIGSFLLPGGPIINALLGAASSLALGSEQFKTFLFGEKQFDEDGNALGRKGGLLGKAYEKIVEPALINFRDSQITLMGWLEQRIISPFITSIKPILLSGKKIVKSFSEKVSGMFRGVGNYLVETVGGPIKSIFNPLIDAYKFIKKSTYRIAGTIISAPFKLLQAVGYAIDIKHRIDAVLKPIREVILDPLADMIKKGIKTVFTTLVKVITAPVRLPLLLAKTLIRGVFSFVKGVGNFLGDKIGGPIQRALDKRADKKRKKELNNQGFINRFKYKWRTLATNGGTEALNPERISAREENRRNVAESKAWEKYQKDWNRHKKKYQNSGLEMMNRLEFDREHGHRSWWAPTNLLGKSKSGGTKAEQVNMESNTTTIHASSVTVVNERGNKHKKDGESDNKSKKNKDKKPTANSKITGKFKYGKLTDSAKAAVSNAYEVYRRRAEQRGETPMSEKKYAKSLWERTGGYIDRIFGSKGDDSSNDEVAPSKRNKKNKDKKSNGFISNAIDSASHLGATRVFVVGGHLDYIGRRIKGNMAEGGEVQETGLYALSRGEKVIPNEPSRSKRDKDRENSLLKRIKNVFKSSEDKAVEDNTYGISVNKTVGEEMAELQNTQKVGSYLEKEKREAEQERTNKLTNLLQSIADNTKEQREISKEHSTNWLDTFGAKKGLFTLAFIALTPIVKEIVSTVKSVVGKIQEWFGPIITDIKEWFGGLVEDINYGLESVGGLNGVLTNINKTVSNILGFLGFKDTTGETVTVNDDGTISLDENGNPTTHEKQRKSTAKERFIEFITPGKTQISLDEDTYGDAYYTNNYNGLSDAKMGLTRQLAGKTFNVANRVYSKVFNKSINTKNNMKLAAAYSKHGVTRSKDKAIKAIKRKDIFTSEKKIRKNISKNKEALKSVLKNSGVDMDTTSTKNFIKNASLEYAKSDTKIDKREAKRISKQLSKKNGLKKYGLTAVGNEVDDVAATVVKNIDDDVTGAVVKKAALNNADDVTGAVVKKAAKKASTSGVSKITSKAATKATTKAATGNSGFLKLCQSVMDKVLELLSKLLTKFKSSKGGAALVKFGKKVAEKTFKNPNVMGRFSGALASIGAKATAAASSFFVTELIGAGIGAISANPAAVFQVDESMVDWKMQAIARVFKGLLGTTVGAVLDVIDSMAMECMGVSFVTELAILVYNLLSSDEEEAALKEARETFKSDYDKLVQDEYDAYAENAKKEGKEVMDMETFKQNGLSTSFSDYVSDRNPSLGKKIWDKAKDIGSNVVGGAKKLGTGIADTITSIPDKISGAISSAGKSVSSLISGFKTMKTDLAKLTAENMKIVNQEGITALFSSSYWTDESEADTTASGNVKSLLVKASKFMILPFAAITGVIVSAKKGIASIISGFKTIKADLPKLTAENMAIVNERGISALFSSSYWTADSEADTTTSGVLKSILTITNKFMTLPFAAVTGVIVSVKKGVDSIISGFKTMQADLPKLTAENMAIVNERGISALFSSSYWTTESEVDTTATGKFKSILTIANKFMTLPFAAVTGVIVSVKNTVNSLVEGFKNLIMDVDTIHSDSMAAVNEKGITALFESSYWDDDSTDTTASGLFKTVLVKGVKFLTLPVMTVAGVFTSVKNTINGVIDTVKKVFSGVDDASKVSLDTSIADFVFVKGTPEDEELGGIARVTKMISRILYLPVFIIRKAFNGVQTAMDNTKKFFKDIGEGIENLWDSFTSGFGDISRFKGKGGFGEPDTQNGFPYYSQNDPTLRNKPYKVSQGDSIVSETMGTRGCGPTAMAMVASSIKGGYGTNPYSPEVMANIATKQNYSNNSGTTPAYFTNVGRQLGMNVRNVKPSAESIEGLLYSGQPVILQGSSDGRSISPYTSAGHYVVAVGTDSNGNVLVNDPRGKEYSHAYTMDQILKGSINAWGFSDNTKVGGYGTISSMIDALSGAATLGLTNTPNSINSPFTPTFGKITLTAPDINPNTTKSNTKKITTFSPYMQKILDEEAESMISSMNSKTTSKSSVLSNVTSGNIINGTSSSTNIETWLSIVKAVKSAMAAQNPTYGNKYISITVGGKTLSVRTDCSGYVTACLKYYGCNVGNMTSASFTNPSNQTMLNSGFVSMPFTGWENLQEGDIIAKTGHVEIYSHTENGKHMVYNCGSTNSLRSATPTKSSKIVYTTVWRPGVNSGVNAIISPYTTDLANEYTTQSSVNTLSSILSQYASAIMTPIQKALYGTTTMTGETTDTTGASTAISSATLQGSDNAQKAFNYLTSKGFTKAGAAGLLGNLYAESGVSPINVEDSMEYRVGGDLSYTNNVDSGSYKNFNDDGVGYGIAQWTYSSRKKNLYNYAKQAGTSIGDLGMQLGFLLHELNSSYPSVMKTLTSTNSVKEASDIVLHKFENPKVQNSSVESRRAGYSQGYYQKYAGANGGFGDTNVADIMRQLENRKNNQKGVKARFDRPDTSLYGGYGDSIYQSIANRSDNVRNMELQNNIVKDERVVKLLGDMLVEMQGANGGISKLNDKEFSVNSNHIDNSSTVNNTNISTGVNNKQTTQKQNKQNTSIDREKYKIAKQIAKGIITA